MSANRVNVYDLKVGNVYSLTSQGALSWGEHKDVPFVLVDKPGMSSSWSWAFKKSANECYRWTRTGNTTAVRPVGKLTYRRTVQIRPFNGSYTAHIFTDEIGREFGLHSRAFSRLRLASKSSVGLVMVTAPAAPAAASSPELVIMLGSSDYTIRYSKGNVDVRGEAPVEAMREVLSLIDFATKR